MTCENCNYSDVRYNGVQYACDNCGLMWEYDNTLQGSNKEQAAIYFSNLTTSYTNSLLSSYPRRFFTVRRSSVDTFNRKMQELIMKCPDCNRNTTRPMPESELCDVCEYKMMLPLLVSCPRCNADIEADNECWSCHYGWQPISAYTDHQQFLLSQQELVMPPVTANDYITLLRILHALKLFDVYDAVSEQHYRDIDRVFHMLSIWE